MSRFHWDVAYHFSTSLASTVSIFDQNVWPLPKELDCLLTITTFRYHGRYLNWIRQKDDFKEVLIKDVNEKETELRNHPDFAAVYDEDKEALAEFRKSGELGELAVEDADT